MEADYLENEQFPIGSLEQGSLSGIAALVKELLTRAYVHEEKQDRLSYWQLIFLQSKVNGGFRRGEDLLPGNWEWPKSTWFQQRLRPSEGSRIRGATGRELNRLAISVSSGKRTNPCYGAEL